MDPPFALELVADKFKGYCFRVYIYNEVLLIWYTQSVTLVVTAFRSRLISKISTLGQVAANFQVMLPAPAHVQIL